MNSTIKLDVSINLHLIIYLHSTQYLHNIYIRPSTYSVLVPLWNYKWVWHIVATFRFMLCCFVIICKFSKLYSLIWIKTWKNVLQFGLQCSIFLLLIEAINIYSGLYKFRPFLSRFMLSFIILSSKFHANDVFHQILFLFYDLFLA